MSNVDLASFGPDFTWGVAHAGHQVEGAPHADGKGLSIWDTFSRRPGRVRHGDTGDVACDWYRRYPHDLDLVSDLGFDAQQFSISWPRVVPDGTGPINPAGLDHYERVVDACLDRGLRPWVTLYHWDLPQALEDRGGWASRDVVAWFSRFVEAVAERLGDRVHAWIVLNEPSVFTTLGYLTGTHAPGRRNPRRFLRAVHHANLAQAAGAAALRAALPTPTVGTALAISPTYGVRDTEGDRRAALRAHAVGTRTFIEPNLGLGYPVDDAPLLKPIERYVRTGDDRALRVDWDFLGVQYFTRARVRSRRVPLPGVGPGGRPDHRRFEVTSTGWEVHPTGIYDALALVSAYGVARLVVTGNGAAFPDTVRDGRVDDQRRLRFVQDHLEQVLRARRDGIPVDGYFCRSLLDGFEWAEGYEPRFGLVHVDHDTQTRIPKTSARWFGSQLATAAGPPTR